MQRENEAFESPELGIIGSILLPKALPAWTGRFVWHSSGRWTCYFPRT
jgi:hypothetical protein